MTSNFGQKKKFRNLDKTWKELLYSFAGFGPNFFMVLMGAYFQNAVNPTALGSKAIATQSISGFCLILPILFTVLWTIAKCFDGIIDIPFANITDSLRTKFGNRRIPIAISFVPMVLSFALCWYPVCGSGENLSNGALVGNTIWIFFWALMFFATYTMSLIAYYGSLSTVCSDEKQKTRVSSYKSVFDTISYALVFALLPVILSAANLRINMFVYFALPLMLTMIIPLFMIKEGAKWEAKAIAQGYDITPLASSKPVKLFQSIKMTCKNKPFLIWLGVNACSFFGLQLFLVSMNAIESGLMELNGTYITICNTCAFAPVPLMLYLFNKLKANNGVRFAFQTALLSFAVAILGFFFGTKFFWPNNMTPRVIIACISGVIGSFGIGAFFMMGYLIPSQISSVEEIFTKTNHSSMYFATQAVTTSISGALSSALLWGFIQNLFFSTLKSGVIWCKPTKDLTGYQVAAQQFGLGSDISSVYNLGAFIVPFIVIIFCIVGFAVAFKMPKRYSHECIGWQIIGKEEYIKQQAMLPKTFVYPFEKASITVYNCLWVLTGSIFSFFWYSSLINAVNTFNKKKFSRWWILLSVVLPPFGAYICWQLNKNVNEKCDELQIKHRKDKALVMIFAIICLNCVSTSLIQHKLNMIANIQNPILKKEAGQ